MLDALPVLKKECMIDRISPIAAMNPPQTGIGVLSDNELLLVNTLQGKRVLHSVLLPPGISEPGSLLEYLWQAELAEVWVMPGTTLSRTATGAWFEQAACSWVVIAHPSLREPTRPVCVLLWPKESRAVLRVALVFPEHAGWGWVLADARSLLATVTYLDQVLARPVIDPPELVAHKLLTSLTLDHPIPSLRPSSVDLSALRAGDGATVPLMEGAREFAWMRPLTLAEQRQRYLHKYVHLSRRLEACLSVRLGAGVPEYSPTGRAYDGIRPGIWRVHAERAGSVFDGKSLPSCLDREWMSTPQIRCCQDISYHVEVREGYSWSRRTTCSHHGQEPCGGRPSACTLTRRATGMSRGKPTLLRPSGCSLSWGWPSWRERRPREDGPGPTGWHRLSGTAGPCSSRTWPASRGKA